MKLKRTMALLSNWILIGCLLALMAATTTVSAWVPLVNPKATTNPVSRHRAFGPLRMNIFSDFGDMISGGKLVPQNNLQHAPLGAVSKEETILAIQERAISFTGESFDVFDISAKRPFCRVDGAMMHLPGKDKMNIKLSSGKRAATLDRKLVAMTPTYDILRGDTGEKLGWVEKKAIALTDSFEVHLEGEGGFGPFKPPAAYKIEGDFIDRRFVMKNNKNEVVAKVTKDSLIQFDTFNHYQLQIASGMDAVLVVACACAIDEEFDEEHKKKKEREQRG